MIRVRATFKPFDCFPDYAVPETAPSIETAGRKSAGYRTYGIGVEPKGNGYFADIVGGSIGKVDANTGKVTLYPTPTQIRAAQNVYG